MEKITKTALALDHCWECNALWESGLLWDVSQFTHDLLPSRPPPLGREREIEREKRERQREKKKEKQRNKERDRMKEQGTTGREQSWGEGRRGPTRREKGRWREGERKRKYICLRYRNCLPCSG